MDDTPLAFLHQPENGVPVLGFRGDPDDRLLMEAVLPLVQVGLWCAQANSLSFLGTAVGGDAQLFVAVRKRMHRLPAIQQSSPCRVL